MDVRNLQWSIKGGGMAGGMEGRSDSTDGEKEKEGRVEEYRRIQKVMETSYKIYVATLADRLREAVEGKGIIPPNQTGFRKGMGTIDNIYVLNYMINRQIE